MRLSFILAALFKSKPETILTITHAAATLAAIKTPTTPYASLTPAPFLINEEHHLVAPFQLRTFIETHLPADHRLPFSIVVILPPLEHTAALRLATGIAAVLLQLNLPAYVITQDATTLPAHQKKCVFFGKATGTKPAWSMLVCTLIWFIASAGAFWLYTPQAAPAPRPMPIREKAAPLQPQRPIITTPLHQPIIAALCCNRGSCHFTRLIGTPHKTEAQFFSQNPAILSKAKQLFEIATDADWQIKAPTYRAGYPPLYYGKMLKKH